MTNNKSKKTILMTGGHGATTALSVIEELRETDINIYWIGSVTAFEGKKVKTLEEMTFDKSKVKTYKIPTGKINRKYPYKSIVSLLKVPLGFVYALIYFLRIKPDVVLSFGGSVSIPVVTISSLFRVPIILHEQTITAGKANLEMARFATKVAISRDQSAKYFPKNKVILTGNPIGSSLRKIKPKTHISSKPKLLVFGGSRGASILNESISNNLALILKKFSVYHITGQIDYNEILKSKQKLPKELQNKYHIYSFIDPRVMYKFYNLADVIISRSGANTISEILIAKRPCILVPIPWTYNDEQTQNAKFVEEIGLGLVLHQDDLEKNNLVSALDKIVINWKEMVEKGELYKSPDLNASQILSSLVLKYI